MTRSKMVKGGGKQGRLNDNPIFEIRILQIALAFLSPFDPNNAVILSVAKDLILV
jgi:hypothetical protein